MKVEESSQIMMWILQVTDNGSMESTFMILVVMLSQDQEEVQVEAEVHSQVRIWLEWSLN